MIKFVLPLILALTPTPTPRTVSVPSADAVCIPTRENEILLIRRFNSLKEALDASVPGSELYLSGGVYKQ
jgi:hypothetical protein